ncbi:hypothetical protein L9F63_009540 [Diploptera punctata]|uniref:Protoporphyrinogen oxidase n=1 Tax=Diploptera punctata TaxID=6984 RepID=A0AAD8ER30_DIPPU|nr:hypothetical protein L9F63_009540 [Diploptera punctata]
MHVVLGGGIGGLSAAYYLLNSGLKNVTLIEASSRLGGWIKTTKTSKGYIFEHGPRTVRPRGLAGENTLQLIEELGLDNKVLPINFEHPAAKNRLIYVNKSLYALPSNITSFLTPQPPFSKPLISALFHDLKVPKKTAKDESMYDFVERRLGKEIAEYAVSPLVCGVCAGDAKEISKSRNPIKVKSELSKRSKKEKWNVWSLDGGLELLPETLKCNIEEKGADVLLNSPCKEILFKSGKAVVKLQDDSFVSDNVICSLPAAQLAPLISKQHPLLSEDLAAIPSVTVGVVNLQYKGRLLNQDAFGFLVPTSQKLPILGVIFDSCCFPKDDNTVLTVMMGGRWFEQLFGRNPSPDKLLSTAVQHVRTILHIASVPENHCVSILKDCIPQYVIGHHERIERIKAYIKRHNLPLSLIGASYDGISVNDVIFSARTAVNDIIQKSNLNDSVKK